MYQAIVFLHVLSVLGFVLLHGISVAAMWRMRAAPSAAHVAAIFDVLPSSRPLRVMLSVIVASGLLAGAMGGFLTTGWLWASLVLLVIIALVMWRLGGGYYELIEAAVTPLLEGHDDAALLARFEAAKASWHVPLVSAAGLVGLALILWLMVAKPF
ncbi:MAG TPA: hypothetical protein VFK38_04055 [Candidatus Limnocylindrales bacterium]|nr:hypothetical protein [Candidatus Limnocylindrales bacterium]